MEASYIQQIVKQFAMWMAVAVLVLILDYYSMAGLLRAGFEIMVEPSATVAERMVETARRPFVAYNQWQNNLKLIRDMKRKLAQLSIVENRNNELERENEQLRLLLEMGTVKQEFVTRWVNIRMGDILLLDAGTVNGIVVDSIVLDRYGLLIGKVGRVGRFVSEVESPTSLGNRIDVVVGDSEARGIVVGDGVSALLEEVLQTDRLETGDLVVTSGENDMYPAGLILGEVIQLTGEQASVTKGGLVRLLAVTEGIVQIIEE